MPTACPTSCAARRRRSWAASSTARSACCVALPGTHSKWACVESGRIVDFMTFMTGEMWHLLLAHSILGRLAVAPTRRLRRSGPGSSAVSRAASVPGNLTHDAFGARTLALMGELEGRRRRRLALRRDDRARGAQRAHLGASAWLRRRARAPDRRRCAGRALRRGAGAGGHRVERAHSHAAAFGLWRIAVQAGLVAIALIYTRRP